MIIKASLGNGFAGALLYIHKDGVVLKEDEKPIIIEKNNVWGSPQNIARLMREQSENSIQLKRPVLHLSLAFAPEDKLSIDQQIECVRASMKHFGISKEKHQYVFVKHNDTNNEHFHIVINRLNYDNKSLNVDWIKNDCNGIADRVEQEYNLYRVSGRNRIFDAKLGVYRNATKEERIKIIEKKQRKVFKDKEPKICEYKTKIQNGINEVLSDISVKTKEAFQAALKTRNIQVKLVENNNEIKGASFRYDKKLSVKGSEVGYRWTEIFNKLEQNKELDQPKKVVLIQEQKAEGSAEPKQITPGQIEKETIDKWEKRKEYSEHYNLHYNPKNVEPTEIKPITDFDFVIRAGEKLYGLIEYSNDYKYLKLQTEEGKIAQTENNRNFNFVKHPKRETNNIELDILNKGKSLLQKGKTPYKLEKSKETGKVLFLSLTEKECYANRSILGVSGDVFITQNQSSDYEDNSIADADKKKNRIKR